MNDLATTAGASRAPRERQLQGDDRLQAKRDVVW